MKIKPNQLLSIILVFFACCLLFHEQVELPFEWFVREYSNKQLSDLLNVFFALFTFLVLVVSYKKLKHHQDRKSMLLYWGVIMIFSYAGYYVLMAYKSEGIHFLQYAIFGYLFYAWLKDAWIAFNLSYLFGILDELYQYVIGESIYLDFNDFILNFLGSAIGILLFATFEKGVVIDIKKSNSYKGWYIYAVVVLFTSIIAIGYLSNVICLYSDDGCSYSLIKWERGGLNTDFWDGTNWGKYWHRVKFWEGLALTSILPLCLFYLFSIRIGELKDD